MRRSSAFRDFPATSSLLTLLVAVFVVQFLADRVVGPRTLIVLGANFGPLFAAGQWWRPLTAAMLHAGVLHLAMNSWALLQLGRLAEWSFGPWTTLALFAWTALTGSALSMAGDVLSVGASGAVFGIEGALVAFFLRHRERLTPAGQAILKQLLAWSGFMILFGFVVPNIDWRGHLGGLAGGLAVGWALRPLRIREGWLARVAGGLAVAALLAALAGMALSAPETLRALGRPPNAAAVPSLRGVRASVVEDRNPPEELRWVARSPRSRSPS